MPFIYVRINSILREYIFAFSFEPRISNIYIKFERWIKTKITTQTWSQMIFSTGHPTPWMVLTTSAPGLQSVNSLGKVPNRIWNSILSFASRCWSQLRRKMSCMWYDNIFMVLCNSIFSLWLMQWNQMYKWIWKACISLTVFLWVKH